MKELWYYFGIGGEIGGTAIFNKAVRVSEANYSKHGFSSDLVMT